MHEEDITFKNRSGKRIHGTLRTPEHAVLGTMVLLHGLGGWKDQYLLVVVAEVVRRLGYQVFSFDAADGAKGPDADFAHSTTSDYVKDLEDVFEYVRNQEWFVGPVLLAAHSQGGLVAARYARTHPGAISKMILLAPAISWRIGFPYTLPFALVWLTRNKHYTPGPGPAHTKLLLHRNWLLDFLTFNVSRDAKKIKTPTLIISAEKDDIVGSPKTHAKVANRFHAATHVVIEGARHIFYGHERSVADTISSWLTSS